MPAEDPNEMAQNATPPPGDDKEPQDRGLMGARHAIDDDTDGSSEPRDEPEKP